MAVEDVLEEVAAEVRVCTKCDLCKNTKNGVPGEGSPHAEVLFIGEAPGFHEDRQGRPFVGPAGQFLNELLGSVGLDRSTALLRTATPCPTRLPPAPTTSPARSPRSTPK